MVAHVATVAFLGLEARAVEVQVQIAAGLPKFLVVGLPDKAVGESRERVHAALAAIGLSLPPKRITVNLSPADLPKEGSHYDLPIALGILLVNLVPVVGQILSSVLAWVWTAQWVTMTFAGPATARHGLGASQRMQLLFGNKALSSGFGAIGGGGMEYALSRMFSVTSSAQATRTARAVIEPARSMWLFLMRNMSWRPMRWFSPPPATTPRRSTPGSRRMARICRRTG